MVLATITAVWHSVFSFALTWLEMRWPGAISFVQFVYRSTRRKMSPFETSSQSSGLPHCAPATLVCQGSEFSAKGWLRLSASLVPALL